MNNKEMLKSIIKKQQDLVRDCQHCLHATDESHWQNFFGQLAKEYGELAHRCLDKLNGH